MHGDYSRGHEPDRKRGRDYRRVLLQMGRPVLDSDVAASVDALLGQVRATTLGLGCAAGSPDLGFLVTAGRLLGVFAEATDITSTGTPNVWVDYRHRYLERYPALYIEAAGGTPASVTLWLPTGADPLVSTSAALWARVETSTTLDVNGTAVPLSAGSPDGIHRVEFNTGGAALRPLQLTLPAGAAVWLFLLEQHEVAGADPAFWVAPGSYHVDGLVIPARGGGVFPSSAFPDAAGFPWNASPYPGPPLPGLVATPTTGTLFVAYLEAWERHITHIEDPGIREEALGSGDTTARTELVGQVKLAQVAGGGAAPAALRAAFDRVESSNGGLIVDVPQSTPTTDPCALPDAAGYRGADNRLYRIEVHTGGGRDQLRLKWSRDNGAELFAARVDESRNLLFEAGTPLATGDIVEVLSSVIDLGDDALAQVSAGGFAPAWRAVGQLAQLAAVDASALSDDVAFTLVDPADGVTPVPLSTRTGTLPDAGLKLRRWHGLIEPEGSVGPFVLEDGITVTLTPTGSYRPGQYWQYEARVRGENANGPWRVSPHGPERRFAPLALLEYHTAVDPIEVVAWLDERFSHPCDLDADDIAFAGARVETDADTVQEALEEIYERLPESEEWPRVAAGGINWTNDRFFGLAQFQLGLRVTFSEEMHPASATPDTFVVSLEVPVEDEGLTGLRRSLIVDGRIDLAGPSWTFVPTGVDADSVGRWVRDLGGPVRCRVRLAGNAILDRTGERPLDGDVVGRPRNDGYDTYIDLRLPSGDGFRGGDFESWFYLTGPAPLVSIEHVNPADGARFAPGTGPRSVLLAFSDNVRFASITANTLSVTVRHSSEAESAARTIPGTLEPYPFESEPGLVSRVTFSPHDPEALSPTQAPAAGPWIFTVRARGTGNAPIVDLDDRALDGAGISAASDFTSRFFVDAGGAVDTLTVYTSLPLQGPARAKAQAAANGIRLALEQVDGRTSRFAIEHVSLDDSGPDGWNPDATAENARKAASDASAIGYIGELDWAATARSIPILSEAKVPQLSLGDPDGVLPGPDDPPAPMNLRMLPETAREGAAIAALARENGYESAYILNDRGTYGAGLGRSVEVAAAAVGIEIRANDAIDAQAANFRSIAAKIKSSGAQCFIYCGAAAAGNAVQVFKDVTAASPELALLGGKGLADSRFFTPRTSGLASAVASRLMLALPGIPPEAFPPAGREFAAAYEAAFGDATPDRYAFYGYEAMRLLLDAIENGGKDRAAVAKRLLTPGERLSVLGAFSIDDQGNADLTPHGVYRVVGEMLVFDHLLRL